MGRGWVGGGGRGRFPTTKPVGCSRWEPLSVALLFCPPLTCLPVKPQLQPDCSLWLALDVATIVVTSTTGSSSLYSHPTAHRQRQGDAVCMMDTVAKEGGSRQWWKKGREQRWGTRAGQHHPEQHPGTARCLPRHMYDHDVPTRRKLSRRGSLFSAIFHPKMYPADPPIIITRIDRFDMDADQAFAPNPRV